MKIQQIIPFLLKDIFLEARVGLTFQKKDNNYPVKVAGETLQALTKHIEQKLTKEPALVDSNVQYSYFPLPLSVEVFKDARFFIKLPDCKYESSEMKEELPINLYIEINAPNLGEIGVSIFCREKNLVVKYFTKTEIARLRIVEKFPTLEKWLIELGFAEVTLTGELVNLEGFPPGFMEKGESLVEFLI